MNRPARLSSTEFVALVALTTSLVAISIDTMLPALGQIAAELAPDHPNDRQLVLTTFFAGLSVGQLVYGPVSDAIGRKRALYSGLGLFILGGLCCALAPSFGVLLAGRALSGFGAAGPRVAAIAVVRDQHSGRAMARVMSFVSSVFILVPVVAPALGQAVLLFASWRFIFWLLVAAAALDAVWFGLRQPETLPPERRNPLSPRGVAGAVLLVVQNPITLGYTLGIGAVFGAFISYLTTSQQLFQELYGVGTLFPVYFGVLAAAIGVASFVNASLVMRLGMQRLARFAVGVECALASGFFLVALALDGHPPLGLFMAAMLGCFFCNGILFGNYNARALEPMGQVAGVAAAITGCISGLVAIAFGTPLGRAYDGTVLSVIGSFVLASFAALLVTESAEALAARRRRAAP
ncbi:MAG TPA: multidrug effflux MFS transporter [Polyangiaceae bacterium]|nr:multidrug effflux MFS transporter [Polyangiaceae bacterium]